MNKISSKMAAAILALYAGQAAAFWRMPCKGVAGVARIDPIVDTGRIAGHMHTIKGANGLTTDCTADDLLASDCTSCQIAQDMSAYWTPQLYFMGDDGSVEAVPEVSGHMTYYKFTRAYTSSGLTEPEALPNGLRYLAGNTRRRNFTLPVPDPPKPWSGEDSTQDALQQKAIGFNCLNYFGGGNPEDTLYRHFLPDKEFLNNNCPDGVRFEIGFPFCWNGELDSDNHQDHMAYPDQGQYGGRCPDGYDRVVNQILFETIYPTQNYRDRAGYFALANGDPTGYSYHGDLFVAWEEGVLQRANEQCGPDDSGFGMSGRVEDCPVFNVVPDDQMGSCKIPLSGELEYTIDSVLQALPGNNPILGGPEPAPNHHDDDEEIVPHPTALASSLVPNLPFHEGSSAGFTDELGNIYREQYTDNDAAPAPTAAANLAADQVEAVLPVMTTIFSTSGGAVYEKVIVKTDVTVTAGSPEATGFAPIQKRRHQHLAAHQHAHQRRHAH